MPTFNYVARTRTGGKQKGTMNADNKAALGAALQKQGLILDSAEEKGKVKVAGTGKKVKSYELLVFTRQLATIISSGLPILQGLDILGEQSENAAFSATIQAIGADVESGEKFSDALRKYPKVFPELYVSMVRAGEAGGDLDGTLLQLSDYLENSEELKRRIKSAMTYPVVAFSMILLIAGGLITFVVPQFATMFKSFGADLPGPTMALITASEIMRSWRVLLLFGAGAAIVMAYKAYAKTVSGRYNIDLMTLRMPVFGVLLRKVSISRFARTLSTLTRSGVSILQALEIVERTAGNEVFAKAIKQAGDSVRGGETLADPLARSEQFPTMVTRMIAIGEQTGALDGMLNKIADFYDSEVKASVDAMTSLIEPILILFMGIVVGSMVLALFLPIFKLSTIVGK